MIKILMVLGLLLMLIGTAYADDCPCGGAHPCNNSMFIDIGDKKFLYIQSTYLCGDVTGDGTLSMVDVILLRNHLMFGFPLLCNSPIITYEILDYNNYIGTNIIRPLKSDIYD